MSSLGDGLTLGSFSTIDSLSALILDSLVGRLILGSFGALARLSSDLLLDRLARLFLGSFSALGRLSYALTLDSFTTRLDSLVDRFNGRFRRLVIRHVFLVECRYVH